MKKTVSQKEFYEFLESYKQLKSTEQIDVILSYIDKNIIEGDPYKAVVHLDKGQQKEIASARPDKGEWQVEEHLKVEVDTAPKCPKCRRVLKNYITVNKEKFCLSCTGNAIFAAGIKEVNT